MRNIFIASMQSSMLLGIDSLSIINSIDLVHGLVVKNVQDLTTAIFLTYADFLSIYTYL